MRKNIPARFYELCTSGQKEVLRLFPVDGGLSDCMKDLQRCCRSFGCPGQGMRNRVRAAAG